MKYSASYKQAHDLQQHAHFIALSQETDGKVKAQLMRAWLEFEWFKRELRGLPRLKAADLLANMRKAQPAALASASTPIELTTEPEPSKESLKNAFEPTVTAPPTPDAHGHQW